MPVQQGDTLHLSLEAALARAEEYNPTLRAERAEARMAAASRLEASPAFLPTIKFDMAGMRTNDPVAVFGLKLRQENFAMEDFDIYSAASRGSAAREAATRRAAGATTYIVTQTYWDAQLAARHVEAMEVALEAARSHARQAEALQQQGLVTGLDARLARVGAAGVETQLLAARAQAANAVSMLRSMLALADSQPVMLSDALNDFSPADTPCLTSDANCYIHDRGDITAYRLGSDAASSMVKSAWSKNLPAIAAFGHAGYYGQSSPWGEGGSNWTIGIGLRWNLFPGLAGVGAVKKAKAEHHAALARYEAAERQAEVEVQSAHRMLEAATEGVEVATAADQEALEALEQARLRYSTGTSSITELLDVQAAATGATLKMHSARRDMLVARAALDFAYGVNDR
jgi:outer membrane protein TolC